MYLVAAAICAATICVAVTSCDSKEDSGKTSEPEKTAVLVIGTKSAYWDNVRLGAVEEGIKQNLNVEVYHYPNDTAFHQIAGYIKSLNSRKEIAGVAGLANESTLDAAYGSLREDISIVVAEGVYVEGGAVSKRYNGTVSLNYDEYATAFTSRIPESKIIVLSYDKGANAEIAALIARNKGKANVMICPIADKSEVPSTLTNALVDYPDAEAVFFCSSNFVTDANLSLCKGLTVYSSDLNAAVEPAVRDGRISLNISIDNYEFGATLVRAIAEIEKHKNSKSIVKYDIPFLITDKSNIDTPERQRLYSNK